MPTVAELRKKLRVHGLPTSGNKPELAARLERALHQDYLKQGGDPVIGAVPEVPERGTCPNDEDPVTLEEFEPGDVVRQLRNTNFTMGNCYHDRTLKTYLETTRRDDGPSAEDMGSLQWPAHSAVWDVPGHGDTVVRTRYGGLQRTDLSRVADLYGPVTAVFVVSATSVPRHAFRGQPSLKTVSLSDTVVRIESEAFAFFRGSLIIPDSVAFIGRNALDTVASIRNPTKGIFTGQGYANKTAAVVEWLGVETNAAGRPVPQPRMEQSALPVTIISRTEAGGKIHFTWVPLDFGDLRRLGSPQSGLLAYRHWSRASLTSWTNAELDDLIAEWRAGRLGDEDSTPFTRAIRSGHRPGTDYFDLLCLIFTAVCTAIARAAAAAG